MNLLDRCVTFKHLSVIYLNAGLIERFLLDFCQKIDQSIKCRSDKHEEFILRIADLASYFEVDYIRECLMPHVRRDGVDGYVDIVWLFENRPIVAFEVDSSLREKSILKLQTIPTEHKFWVYYGTKDAFTFVEKLKPISRITIVTLSSHK